MNEIEKIEIVMEKYRQPAIMVHRPYPPVGLTEINSYLGGRPRLPRDIDWPLTNNGIPLHFLAQIDCAELPSTEGLLPDAGVLYFFARIDEEMLWGESGDPADDCRVLFAPLGTRAGCRFQAARRSARATLPALAGDAPPHQFMAGQERHR